MLKDQAPKAAFGTTAKARGLRRRMTPPEVLLWQVLRQRPSGLKFRRQHPSGPFILDFYCSDARVAVEIDGEGHAFADRPTRDERRDGWFDGQGITTVRIGAREVMRDVDGIAGSVVAACVARLPLHHPAAPGGPPPRDKLGED